MSGERGSASLWLLGLGLALLLLGGMSLDLWKVLGDRRELAALADAAAVAAASGVDEAAWRATGEVVLDAERATTLALGVLAGSAGEGDLSAPPVVEVSAGSVRVFLVRQVDFTVLGLLVEDGGFTVEAESWAAAVLRG